MVVAFDLDDTLFSEIDFARSAAFAIGCRHNAIRTIESGQSLAQYFDLCGLPIEQLIGEYRAHRPEFLPLPVESVYVLESLRIAGATLALITDGRSGTQRAKINALRLRRWFDDSHIFISGERGAEKISGLPFRLLREMHPGEEMWMVGDNPTKDFAPARKEGFRAVCLKDRGVNIHPQMFNGGVESNDPDFIIGSLLELPDLVC